MTAVQTLLQRAAVVVAEAATPHPGDLAQRFHRLQRAAIRDAFGLKDSKSARPISTLYPILKANKSRLAWGYQATLLTAR